MDKKTILVVDDELKIRILLKDFLEDNGFRVLEAKNGKEALHIFHKSTENIDMFLLDIMLPEIDGWSVCREVRKISDVPIIMLTARSEDFDEVHGFEIGADDYVKKPVKPSVLIARINALFRKQDKFKGAKKVLNYEGIEIDYLAHIVKVDDEEIMLSPKEYELLLILCENAGNVITREQLLSKVWGYEYFGGVRTVDTHVNRLRNKLGRKGDLISTIRGYGYKVEA